MEHINQKNLKDKNMYYQAIIAFETGVLDNEGNAKVKKFKYIDKTNIKTGIRIIIKKI